MNRLFVLTFKNNEDSAVHTKYYLPLLEIKNYVMIDERNYFDQPVKDNFITYDNIRKIAIGQGDGCATGSLL